MNIKDAVMKVKPMKDLKFNYLMNVLDGGFFGFALGFASFASVIPLFVSTMTNSAILIGLIPAIHAMGWQLPQLFTAGWVARQKRFKPMTMWLTVHERVPFLGLAIIAWFLPWLGPQWGLVLTFLMLIWQGFGGGFTANPWQNLIIRVIPSEYRATFFGSQNAALNFLASGGALAAGFILEKLDSPLDFSICFFIASIWLIFSWVFLSKTREPEPQSDSNDRPSLPLFQSMRAILAKDKDFRWYLVSRLLFPFASMAFAFYTVYAVRKLGISIADAGVMTSILFMTQVIANPVVGWVADRWNRKSILAVGAVTIVLSSILASVARDVSLFYIVMVLTGLGVTAYWTIGMAITLEFGEEVEKPVYIGLANTLIAPATILSPVIGGWLADSAGYETTFLVAAVAGVMTFVVVQFLVREPEIGR